MSVDTHVELHDFFTVNPQTETQTSNPLPDAPALDEECESMDYKNMYLWTSRPEPNISTSLIKSQNAEQASVEATIESNAEGGTESSCDNINLINLQTSTLTTSDGDREKSLEYADELMERGSKASKDHDYSEATDCYSRSLEIRAAHYGELAPECVNSYYKYGCVLLYKAQEEADPLGAVPKKEGESSSASVSGNGELEGSSKPQEGAADDVSGRKDQEENDEESDAEDLPEGDEDSQRLVWTCGGEEE
ncbi:unnamed protein product [Camellia sinensis]